MSLSTLLAKLWAIKVFGQYGNVKVLCHIVPGPSPIKYKTPMSPNHISVSFIALSNLEAEKSAIKVSEICHSRCACYCFLAHGPGAQQPIKSTNPVLVGRIGIIFITLSHLEAQMWTIVIFCEIWSVQFFAMHVCSTQTNTPSNQLTLCPPITTAFFHHSISLRSANVDHRNF